MKLSLLATALVLSLSFSASACEEHAKMHEHGKDMPASSMAFMKANETMHKNMDMELSGDPDADFIKGMIPHHQGAIDMAKVELQYGKDPEAKKLATDIIAAQEKEIAWMNVWLKKHAKK